MATNAAVETLDRVWSVLAAHNRPAALMGGISLAAWNHIRATRDVDLLIAVDESEVELLVAELRPHGFRLKQSTALVDVGDFQFIPLLYTPPDEFYDVQLDLMVVNSKFHESAFERRLIRSIGGLETAIPVLTCEDLILFKLLAGRVIDHADASMLLRENHANLDQNYLQHWLKELKLESMYAMCCDEAFPPDSPLQ